ncbi:transposase [Oxobacter pfennigii]|uniref:transposase n=1 Tax=Oxobacter pfennigii TaxID=36849 RepID=UPI00128F1E1F
MIFFPKIWSTLNAKNDKINKKEWGKYEKGKICRRTNRFHIKQAELGTSVDEVCRKIGISEQTFYRWKTNRTIWFQPM